MPIHIRRCLTAVLISACLAASAVAPVAAGAKTPPPPRLTVPASTLKTTHGVQLWSRRPNTERRVASTIKMLNALVVRDHAKLDDVVRVSKKAAAIDDGDVGLVTGQRLTVRQLLNIMLIASANDAAEALAIHISGSEKKYVKLMNAKAKALGLKHTRAADAHGLSKRECSSANDLSVLAKRVMADSELRKIVRKRSVVVPHPGHRSSTVPSTDLLLGHYKGLNGVKTGFTNPAGYCFVGSAKRGKIELVGVVLGAGSLSGRFSQMRKLLDWGFKNTRWRQLASQTTTIALTPVGEGPLPKVVVHPSKTVGMPLLLGSPKVKKRVVTPKPVRLPVKAGQRLATMEIRQGTTLLTTVPLLALTDVSAPATPSVPTTVASSPALTARLPETRRGILEQVYAAVLNLWRSVATESA